MDRDLVTAFQGLFQGRDDAWGTGKGAVVRGSLRETHFAAHLAGWQPGLGIFPLRDDGTVSFAAIDLDEPDREAALVMRELLPGENWIELSRSGNYHIWTFFEQPIEGWIARGILKLAAEGAGKPKAEIFPKQDRLLPGMIGNYINLPYFGDERPMVMWGEVENPISLETFLGSVLTNKPEVWYARARRLKLKLPDVHEGREQGTAANLHCCAEKIIAERETNPVAEGHRNVVLFNLAKMLLDWKSIDDDEAWFYLTEVNSASPDPLPPKDLRRTFENAKRGGWTSTGCDNPLMAPYVSPNCPIANGLRAN